MTSERSQNNEKLARPEFCQHLEMPIFQIPAWVPTRSMLLEVTEYWARLHVVRAWNWFSTGVCSGREERTNEDLEARLDELGALIGSDIVEAVRRETIAAFGEGCPPDEWNAFNHGTVEERDAATTRLRLELERLAEGDFGVEPEPESHTDPANTFPVSDEGPS